MSQFHQKLLGVGTIVALLMALAGVLSSVNAQNGDGVVEGIRFTAATCDSESAEFYGECVGVNGATFQVLADGTEVTGSPFTTAPGLVDGDFSFDAPAGSELTITSTGGVPSGYAPGVGYDPLVVNVDDLPIGGCGGESSCPVIEFRFLPVEDNGDNGNGDGNGNDDIDTLPNTGTGATSAIDSESPMALATFAIIALIVGAVSRRRSIA